MENKINDFLEYMKKKYNITAAMVTGSYVTGKMGPNSDINMFFLWDDEKQSMRGREYYLDLEFEYFISPEWKYYDRLKLDTVSMRIYSTGKILYDKENKLHDIQKEAIERVGSFTWNLTEAQKKDMKYYIETIQKDGLDMYEKKDYSNFLLFTSSTLEEMCKIICKTNDSLTV